MYPALVREDDGYHARWRPAEAAPELDFWVDEFVRRAVVTPLYADAEEGRYETLHDAWLAALRSRTGLVRWDAGECERFAAELAGWASADDAEVRRATVFTLQGTAAGFTLVTPVPRGRAALTALGRAVAVWGTLREMRRSGDRLAVALTRAQAEDFVARGAADLRAAGYSVEVAVAVAEVTATCELPSAAAAPTAAVAPPRLRILVGGEAASAEELRFILAQRSPLVFFRDRWLEVDPAKVREALRVLERRLPPRLPPLAFALGIGAIGTLEVTAAAAPARLRTLLGRLRRRDGAAMAAADGFAGELRDYQRRGVAWLRLLTDNGLGALLADDMGLGKTVQAIAWILAQRAPRRVLVVAPLTLVANWEHELRRFAPTLAVYCHLGQGRHFASGFRRAATGAEVTLTSVSLFVRDYDEFAEIDWSAAVVDEAQLMKNPATRLARSLCALAPPRRLALTGTPIENSVADLWSLEQFLNPGLLGERRAFEERFVRPLALDPGAAAGARLKAALEPLVLRRLKTDPGIAAELGPKHEIREYCPLTATARSQYERALADYRAAERSPGDAFALLTQLKLICDDFAAEDAEAGKFARLLALLEEVFANGESALVFTPYAKVGARLQAALAARFERKIHFLHGALSNAERQAEIRSFTSSSLPSAFVLSLKAGGVGLNLVKATHVIHYDRWWNPAAENQATDRAHRIGQRRAVFVHLMITVGTLEERIDALLRRKRTLAELVKDGEEFWQAVALK